MANYKEDIVNIELENGTLHRSYIHHSIGEGDALANRYGVRVFRNGQPVQLTGTCSGLFIRADGTTVVIPAGSIEGNVAYVTLTENCYVVEGVFCLAIKITTDGETVTLRIVDGIVTRTSTDSYDSGTIIPSIEALISAINEAAASVPADYSALMNDVKEIYGITNTGTTHYKVTSQSGWAYTQITPYIELKKGDRLDIRAKFSEAPATNTYIYLKNGDTGITSYQCKDLTTKQISYTAPADTNNFNLVTNSQTFTGTIEVTITVLNRQNQVETNRITAEEIGKEEAGYYSIQRLSPFIRGGYDYPDFNYNTHQISSRDVMTAPFDMYIRVKSGFHAKALMISGGTATDTGWQTSSLYIPKGTNFVMKIERATPDTSEVADIQEFMRQVMVFDAGAWNWFDITRYADKVEGSKTISFATGEEQSAGGYYLTFRYYNPAFRFIRLFASVYGRDIAEIAFYNSETISSQSYMGGANAGSWVQEHWIYAEVPDGCKMVCFVSRNLLNDNTKHEIRIYADNSAQYSVENVLYKHDALSLFDGYKYVYHFNANRLGQAEIPLNSLMDIDMAHRLGFRAYEINARQTATPGCYVCMHGNSGKIGAELVARDGTDITNIEISAVTKTQFEEDYVYNTPNDQMKTRVAFLDEALIRCRKYGMIPFISWPGYDGIDFIRKYAGNRFVLIIYDQYYIGRTAWKGAINLYKTLNDATFEEIVKTIEKPFVASLTSEEVDNMTADEIKARIQLCHENNCIIGAAGVYQTAAENMALFDLGLDYLASGWEVEDFGEGNLASLKSNGTFTGFTHNGTVSGGVLALANGEAVSAAQASQYLAKGCLKIRFSGTLVFDFGTYIDSESITSDGTKDVIMSTAFFRQAPGFTATASGAVSIYEICYDASAC